MLLETGNICAGRACAHFHLAIYDATFMNKMQKANEMKQ